MLLNEVAKNLIKRRKTIAVSESCTGGLISHALTNISGSSKYFKLGMILYSSNMKSKLLNINKKSIKRFGAVSKEIAILMANKVRALAKTHIGLATTGFAGPKGGNKKNPVGTVYIALSYRGLTFQKNTNLAGRELK